MFELRGRRPCGEQWSVCAPNRPLAKGSYQDPSRGSNIKVGALMSTSRASLIVGRWHWLLSFKFSGRAQWQASIAPKHSRTLPPQHIVYIAIPWSSIILTETVIRLSRQCCLSPRFQVSQKSQNVECLVRREALEAQNQVQWPSELKRHRGYLSVLLLREHGDRPCPGDKGNPPDNLKLVRVMAV